MHAVAATRIFVIFPLAVARVAYGFPGLEVGKNSSALLIHRNEFADELISAQLAPAR
jgi:hypothetical protein